MKVRQRWEKQDEENMPAKQKLGQICPNCGVPLPLLFLHTDASVLSSLGH